MEITTGKELKEWRESLGWSQAELGGKLGCVKSTICKNEKRENNKLSLKLTKAIKKLENPYYVESGKQIDKITYLKIQIGNSIENLFDEHDKSGNSVDSVCELESNLLALLNTSNSYDKEKFINYLSVSFKGLKKLTTLKMQQTLNTENATKILNSIYITAKDLIL